MALPNSIILTCLTLFFTSVSAQKLYIPYSYSGATGPDKWGVLSPSFAKCGQGKAQSPIDIVKKHAVHDPKLPPLSRNYFAPNATLVNNGFNIGISYGNGAGVAEIDGKQWVLKQMHWHTPSEHRINGQRFAAELHLVHVGTDGNLAVVAILYEYGDPDPLVNHIWEKLNLLRKETSAGDIEAHVLVNSMKTKLLNRKTKKYFRYVGSLTVPPCPENITWTILGKVRRISKEQVEALRAPLTGPYKNNSRPIQALNGRTVQFYSE